MSARSWPSAVYVGHTLVGHASDRKLVILDCERRELTPDEARTIARELALRADYQDRTHDTYAGPDGIPHRRCPKCEGRKTVWIVYFADHGAEQRCDVCKGEGEV